MPSPNTTSWSDSTVTRSSRSTSSPGRTAPARGTGSGGDDQPGGGLPFGRTIGERYAVARRLVAGVANVDLVERGQRLPIVGHSLDHGAFLDVGRVQGEAQQIGQLSGIVANEDSRIPVGFGVDANDRLAG